MTRRKSRMSPEDVSLWEALTHNVAPLRGRSECLTPPAKALPRRGVLPQASSDSSGPRSVARWPEVPGLSVPGLLSGDPEEALFRKTYTPLDCGRLDGMDGKTAERLRKGQISVEGSLDLHGMTQVEAEAALVSFVRTGWERGWRSVLVVTGRGYRAGQPGVLRQRLPDWLNKASLRPYVVGFTHAHQKDGGLGAYYVRLRRQR